MKPSIKIKPTKKRRNKKIGLPPGSVIYTGDAQEQKLHLEIFDFNENIIVEHESQSVEDILKFENSGNVSWININGLNKTDEIEKLGSYFKLHPLLLEDIVNVSQRTKLDEYENCIFVVCKMPHYKDSQLLIEHISFVMGLRFLLSFQEFDGDVFEPIRDRLRNDKGIVRQRGSDYLLFALLDLLVDNFSIIVDEITYKTESLEDILLSEKYDEQSVQNQIQELKREILRIRKAIYPLREIAGRLPKIESHISKKNFHYLESLNDQITQIIENIDLNRELVWGLMDLHMTTLSNKMNQVMKVLTVMASIFIPLTFIAGVYGMNFEFMPELKMRFAYPLLMGLMLVILLLMVLYFKRKKWL